MKVVAQDLNPSSLILEPTLLTITLYVSGQFLWEADSEMRIFRQAKFGGVELAGSTPVGRWGEGSRTREKEKLSCNEMATKA